MYFIFNKKIVKKKNKVIKREKNSVDAQSGNCAQLGIVARLGNAMTSLHHSMTSLHSKYIVSTLGNQMEESKNLRNGMVTLFWHDRIIEYFVIMNLMCSLVICKGSRLSAESFYMTHTVMI